MKYNGILLVGEKNYDFVTLIEKLLFYNQYELQRVVGDNNCNDIVYIDKDHIDNIESQKFLLKWKNGENTYAIFKEEFEEKLLRNKIPVIILPQYLLDDFMATVHSSNLKFMSIYIYSSQTSINSDNDEKKMRAKDKKIIDKCIYSISDNAVDKSCSLIDRLWQLQGTGGGLSRDIIENMVQCNMLIEKGNLENISNASYDLCLGDEYYYSGKINKLDNKNPFIAIEPYDYVIASCDEKIIMPRDVSARFDVSVNLFCQGIILSNSTQVDPGFRGKLFCLLFNTSNKVVYLKRRMHYATLEFNKLVEPTTAYKGKYADEDSIVPYLPPNIMLGAINELKEEIEKLQTENQKMQSIYLSVLALFLTFITIFLYLK